LKKALVHKKKNEWGKYKSLGKENGLLMYDYELLSFLKINERKLK